MSAVGHWIAQRVSAVLLLVLVLYGALFVSVPLEVHALRAWLSSMEGHILTIGILLTLFWHAQLGLEVIVDDYCHVNSFLHIGVRVVCVFFCVLGVGSVLWMGWM